MEVKGSSEPISTLPPDDENGEQVDEDDSTFEEDDKPSLADRENDLSTTILGETKQNKTKELISELKNLEDVEDPVKKLTMLSQTLEENGKLPPKMTETLESMLEGDTKAIGELCNILSEDSSTNIGEVDCSKLPNQSNDTVVADIGEYGAILAQAAIKILEAIAK